MAADHDYDSYAEHYGKRDDASRAKSNSNEEFEKLCRDIGNSVGQISDALSKSLSDAGSTIGSAVNQAVEGYKKSQTKAQLRAARKQEQMLIDSRFALPKSLSGSGVVRSVIGGILSLSFGSAVMDEIIQFSLMDISSSVIGLVITGVLFGLSVKLLVGGIKRIKASNMLNSLRRIMGTKEFISINDLSNLLDMSHQKTVNDIKYLLKEGAIPEGHMDQQCSTLMVTNNAYEQYLRMLEAKRVKQIEDRRAEEAKRIQYQVNAHDGSKQDGASVADDLLTEGLPPKIAAFIGKGAQYIDQMRKLDICIDDAQVSERIVRIEDLAVKILLRARSNPDVIDELGKFMDYYLPTTIKLLSAYEMLEEQEVQGDNIISSRHEIESTLDVLIQAYEKLLDATFMDLSMDVSSEISVLNVVLAQEGLTDNPFQHSEDNDIGSKDRG